MLSEHKDCQIITLWYSCLYTCFIYIYQISADTIAIHSFSKCYRFLSDADMMALLSLNWADRLIHSSQTMYLVDLFTMFLEPRWHKTEIEGSLKRALWLLWQIHCKFHAFWDVQEKNPLDSKILFCSQDLCENFV